MATLTSNNALYFCSKLSAAIYYLLMRTRKVTIVLHSSCQPQTNGGTERVDHTVAIAVNIKNPHHIASR